ncbi:MAG: DUF4838 domain-containing protein, partial [Armatimonadetes bacterium]|nr:DUF4838 domain-containing protein [Armatimonadota bacterium]
ERWRDSLPGPPPNLSPTGFRITISEEAITLVGGSPKGTLNAAYELLERLGLRWPVSSVDVLPASSPKRLQIGPCDFTLEPSFPRITLFQDLRTLRDYSDPDLVALQARNDRDLVAWMGRNRFTGLFGNLPEAPEPWADAARRGIRRQSGGHLLSRLLPRDLFDTNPDLFPMDAEGNRFRGNLCASNPEALRIVCENAEAYVRETSPELLHLWGEDALSGRWCACSECGAMSVQDQYLRVVNEVADHLAGEFPSLKVAFIAYHDTLEPKLSGTPRPNVVLLFAPRNRCYRHALADPDCPRNAEICRGLQEYRRIFGPGRLHTFEYYADALLWCSAAIVLPRLIVEDVRAYHAAGVVDSGCLMFGGYSWFSHPLNLFAFSRVSYDVGCSAEEIIGEFTRHLFAGAEAEMLAYYTKLEDAARLLVERTDWFYRVPEDLAAAQALLPHAEEAEIAWETLTGTLNEALACAKPAAGIHLVRERQALRFSQHLVRAYRRRIQAATLRGPDEPEGMAQLLLRETEAEIRSALRILHDLSPYLRGSWGAADHGEPLRLRQLLASLHR